MREKGEGGKEGERARDTEIKSVTIVTYFVRGENVSGTQGKS